MIDIEEIVKRLEEKENKELHSMQTFNHPEYEAIRSFHEGRATAFRAAIDLLNDLQK